MTHERHVSVKTGLPPGTAVYIGAREAENTKIVAFTYNNSEFRYYSEIQPDDIKGLLSQHTICWIHISGLHDMDKINRILELFHLHPLISEDIFNTKGRAKCEDFGNALFIILDLIAGSDYDFYSQKIDIVAMEETLISVSENGFPFSHIEERIRHPNGKFRVQGSDYLMYSLIDTITDSYFYALEFIEDTGEILEEKVLENPKPRIIHHIHAFRHRLISLRRQVWSVREVIMHLERNDSNIIRESTRVYLRDVYDHAIKISEDLDVHREMAEEIMEIYLSSISNKTNEVVRILTVIAVIFIPLTFITGVYGMNFAYLPGLNHPFGFMYVFILMGIISIVMIGMFRWKKWI